MPEERTSISFEQTANGERQSTSKWAGIRTVLGGMLAHLMFGTLYCWGNFGSYAPQHLKNFNAQAAAMPLGPLIIPLVGPGFTVLIAGCLCSSGIYFAANAPNLRSFAFFYGAVYGGGIGLGYTAPLVAGWKHFPHAKGTVSGFVVGAFGFGAFIFNNVGTKIFNPDGLAPDSATKLYPKSVTDNFGSSMETLAIIYFVMALAAAPLVRNPKVSSVVAVQGPSTGLCQALGTKYFWKMWLSLALSAQGPLFIAANYKGIAINSPALNNDGFLALVGALGGIMNGVSRPIWGMFFDALDFKKVLCIVAFLEVVVLYSFPKILEDKLLFALGVMAAYAVLGGNFAIAPPEVQKLFGNPTVFGLMFTAFAFASLGGSKLADMAARTFASDTWNHNQVTFTWLSFVSLLALFVVQFHGKPKLAQPLLSPA